MPGRGELTSDNVVTTNPVYQVHLGDVKLNSVVHYCVVNYGEVSLNPVYQVHKSEVNLNPVYHVHLGEVKLNTMYQVH